MSKISRRKFIASSAAAVGTSLIGGAALSSPSALANLTKNTIAPDVNKNRETYDASLKFTHWSFGGIENSSPLSAKSADFKYWFDPVIENKTYSYRDEVYNACKKLDELRAGKTIALCYSGGIDSEVIALALEDLKIPYELYFLDFFGLNIYNYHKIVRPFVKKLHKDLNVVCLSKEYFTDFYVRETMWEFGCENPNAIGMTYLFRSIPSDRYIVTGDGDLHREGALHQQIGNNYPAPNKGWFLSYSTTSVLYHLWAQKYQRSGTYYFYSSTPELLGAVINNPHYGLAYPFGFTRSVIKEAFPQITLRDKNNVWNSEEGKKASWQIRKIARNFLNPHDEFSSKADGPDFWKPSIGTAVDLNGIFKKPNKIS